MSKKNATTIIYVPDMTCDSCGVVLKRALTKSLGISAFRAEGDRIVVTHDATIHPQELVRIVRERGYRASLDPTLRTSFRDRVRDFREHPAAYAIERTILRNAAITFCVLIVLQTLALVALTRVMAIDATRFAPWLFYLALSVSVLGAAGVHLYSYRRSITMMAGMMIGMTLGMQTGLLLGAIVAVTNGFFFGAIIGMVFGIVFGAIAGSQCGVMGFMEGTMAGVMGGTMGAMTTFMMYTDHLTLFMPLFVAANVLVLFALMYMLYEETVEGRDGVTRTPISLARFASIALIVTLALSALMLVGPKSIFFS